MIYYQYGNRSSNKIALTFDDGPNPPITLQLLDILDDFDVKGNFFLLGKWAKNQPGTVSEIFKRGHLVGNHGYNHEELNPELETTSEIIFKILGVYPEYVRPPYCSKESLKTISSSPLVKDGKVKVVTFDIDPDDSHMPGSEVILKRVVKSCKNGSIIDLHDSSNHQEELATRPLEMLKALPDMIRELKKNFEIVRLDQMDLMPQELEIDS